MIKNSVEYIEKTYSGWLGKIIGIRLGSPIEGWTYETIKRVHGEICDYLVDYKDYAADDDSNGPLFFVRALIDYSHKIDEISEKDFGYTLLNYAPENHGFFWWGGYGVSTEHTAYYNIKNGIDAPRSGSIEQNGLACAEQIGGQIFSDCWGFIAPYNPKLAAQYAKKMSSVTHDGEGIYGGMFVAACISCAYEKNNVMDIIKSGLDVIPEDSEYALVVNKVIDFYNNDDTNDWHNCFDYIYKNFGYDKYSGNCHIIPNTAVMIMSMLYGDGDFSKSQCICNMAGWDTDCNAGNVGAILGVMVGIEGIEHKWIKPINDLLISSSVLGSLNISTVSQSTEVFTELGFKVMNMEPPELWKKRFDDKDYNLHFDFPMGTQAMRVESKYKKTEVNIKNSPSKNKEGRRALQIYGKLSQDEIVTLFHKTYYNQEDLHDSRYDPSFSPVIYPGQIIETELYNDCEENISCKIFAYDINNEKTYTSEVFVIKSDWQIITYEIPIGDGILIKEVGVEFFRGNNSKNTYSSDLNVYMDYIKFTGKVDYNINCKKEVLEVYEGHHRERSQFSYLNGLWEYDGEWLSGSCYDSGESYTGYYYLKDYIYESTIKPIIGHHHFINFRVQGGAYSYAFGFFGEGKLSLLKKFKDYTVLEEVEYNYELHQEYTLMAKVINNKIQLSINGQKVIDYVDNNNSYDYGQVGVGVHKSSHCHFKDFKIKSI